MNPYDTTAKEELTLDFELSSDEEVNPIRRAIDEHKRGLRPCKEDYNERPTRCTQRPFGFD